MDTLIFLLLAILTAGVVALDYDANRKTDFLHWNPISTGLLIFAALVFIAFSVASAVLRR